MYWIREDCKDFQTCCGFLRIYPRTPNKLFLKFRRILVPKHPSYICLRYSLSYCPFQLSEESCSYWIQNPFFLCYLWSHVLYPCEYCNWVSYALRKSFFGTLPSTFFPSILTFSFSNSWFSGIRLELSRTGSLHYIKLFKFCSIYSLTKLSQWSSLKRFCAYCSAGPLNSCIISNTQRKQHILSYLPCVIQDMGLYRLWLCKGCSYLKTPLLHRTPPVLHA